MSFILDRKSEEKVNTRERVIWLEERKKSGLLVSKVLSYVNYEKGYEI